MSVRMVTNGFAGEALRRLSHRARLKCGTSEATRSGLRLPPIFLQQPHRLSVIHPNHALQHAHQLRASQGPAILQHAVIDVLDAQSSGAANDVDRIEYLLQIYEFYFQGQVRLLDRRLKGHGGISMPPSRVEVNKRDTLHRLPILARESSEYGLLLTRQYMQRTITR